MSDISIIVAIAENYAIGKNNQLLWHIPDDLKRFKKLTSGCTVVMGRNTYLSLPVRPLPNRKNIVISDIKTDKFEGCIMAYSIEEAMGKFDTEKENFIIGGGMVYRLFLPLANKLYLTRVHQSFDADIFFPEIDFSQWHLIENERYSQKDPELLDFSYQVYKRQNQI